MMRTSAAVVTTRSLDVVSAELNAARARRDLHDGREDSVSRWRREMLEMEEARAREGERDRNLTDAESVRHREFLEGLVTAASAEIYAHIASLQRVQRRGSGRSFCEAERKDP
jgi:hypothetical protein